MESYHCINSRVMEFRMFLSSPGSVCTAPYEIFHSVVRNFLINVILHLGMLFNRQIQYRDTYVMYISTCILWKMGRHLIGKYLPYALKYNARVLFFFTFFLVRVINKSALYMGELYISLIFFVGLDSFKSL